MYEFFKRIVLNYIPKPFKFNKTILNTHFIDKQSTIIYKIIIHKFDGSN